jgi:hypothetical protein
MKTLITLVVCLGIVSCALADEQNPEAKKAKSRKELLVVALAGADRLVIQPLFESQKKYDLEIKGADKLEKLLAAIEIDDRRSGPSCNCNGDHWLTFYEGEQKLLTLGHHHHVALRWHAGKWRGDSALSDKSQEALPRWFKENGYPVLLEMRENEIRRAKEEREAFTRFVECFPEKARKHFSGGTGSAMDFDREDKEFGKKLAEAVGGGKELAVALCRAFGTLKDYKASWSSTEGKERRADSAAQSLSGDAFLAALNAVKDDRPALLGAARLYFWNNFRSRLPDDVRTDWDVRLSEVVLADGWDGNKALTLDRLRSWDSPPARALLQKVRRGEAGKEIARKKAWDDDPGIRATATLLLVRLGEKGLEAEIKRDLKECKVEQDKAAYEIALALLGDPSYLKPEQFTLKSYTIGNAGLQAIEQFKGKHGLEALCTGAIHHPWAAVNDQAVSVFQKVTGKKFNKEQIATWWAEGAEGLNPNPSMKNIGLVRAWRFESFGRWGLRPDATQLAVAQGNDVVLYSVQTGEKEQTLKGHTKPVEEFHFAADSKTLVSLGFDQTARVWDLASGKATKTIKYDDKDPLALFSSAEGTLLLVKPPEKNVIRFRDFLTDREATAVDMSDGVMGFSLSLAAARHAIASEKGTVTVWDTKAGKKSGEWKAKVGGEFQLSPQAKWLLAFDQAAPKAIIWDAATGAEKLRVEFAANEPSKFQFSPDDKFLFAGDNKGYVHLYDPSAGKELAKFHAHANSIKRIEFSHDGKRVLTSSWDGSVKIWDVAKILAQK